MDLEAREDGFTLVELTVAMVVFAIAAISFFGLYNSLIRSTIVAKREAVALTLATNQMEYLKSLPYDNLIVIGGSIPGTGYIQPTSTQTINGVKYTVTTSINYVDDAADHCANIYATTTDKLRKCRGSTTSTPTDDNNGADYKIAHVLVTDPTGAHLAETDTEIAAKVAEAASTQGALIVNVIDESGNPLPGATVTVVNNTVIPTINLSGTTDIFGSVTFFNMPPDSGTDYVITASKSGYSTLTTINKAGSLQPTYPNQKMLAQQGSYSTLRLYPQGVNSLLIEAVDTNGNHVANLSVAVKGGYKKYTDPSDTSYCFDTTATSCSAAMTPSTTVTTGGDGMATLSNLVPGGYIFCGDDGSSGCKVGSTTYYLVSALPYGGTNSLSPITVPTYFASSPPSTTYPYNGQPYLQEVRLIVSSSANFPRVFSLNPYEVSKSAGTINNFSFTITGQMLSCGNGLGCSSNVKFVQGANTYTANCTGGSGGDVLNCTVDLTGISTGTAQLVVGTNNGTIALPTTPLGGLNVTP